MTASRSRSWSTEYKLNRIFSARWPTQFCIPLLLQCFSQVSLTGAARPASNDDTGEGRRARYLHLAVMHPEGALQKLEAPHNASQQMRSSLLQSEQTVQSNEKLPDLEEIDDTQDLARRDAARVGHVNMSDMDSQPNTLGVNGTVPTQEGERDSLENGTENDLGEVHQTEEQLAQAKKIVSGEMQDGAEQRTDEVPKKVDAPEQTGESSSSKPEETVPALAPGEEVKMFRTADGRVGEMEEAANKLQEHLTGVDSAWGKVDGKLTNYHESIEDLGKQFKRLTESVHGIHDAVKTEFLDKEKLRMCTFMNAKRVLRGEPEVDCNTNQELHVED